MWLEKPNGVWKAAVDPNRPSWHDWLLCGEHRFTCLPVIVDEGCAHSA